MTCHCAIKLANNTFLNDILVSNELYFRLFGLAREMVDREMVGRRWEEIEIGPASSIREIRDSKVKTRIALEKRQKSRCDQIKRVFVDVSAFASFSKLLPLAFEPLPMKCRLELL